MTPDILHHPRRRDVVKLAGAAAAVALGGRQARAEIQGDLVRIGVLTDMSGPFADQVGPGSVAAARLAVEDIGAKVNGMKVKVLSGDHQNKADIGVATARRWVEQFGVDAVVDLPNSAVALAVNERDARKAPRVTCLRLGHSRSHRARNAARQLRCNGRYDTWALGQQHGASAAGAEGRQELVLRDGGLCASARRWSATRRPR